MAEIIEDIKISILEVTDDLGINFTSDNPQILHTGAGSLTMETTSEVSDALTLSAPNGGIVIDSGDSTNGIQIGTNNNVPVTIGYNGNNVNILGNLVVSGNMAIGGTTIEHEVIVVTSTDPVLTLNFGMSGLNTYDIGFVGERGTAGQNIGWIWNESNKEFAAVGTSDSGASDIVHPIDNYKPARFGGLNVVSDISEGTPTVFNVDVNGAIDINTTDAANGIEIGTYPAGIPVSIGWRGSAAG